MAAIAIPRFGNFRENAEIKQQVANARTMLSAYSMYLAEGKEVTGDTITAANLSPYLDDNSESLSGYTINLSGGDVESVTTPRGTWTPGSDTIN